MKRCLALVLVLLTASAAMAAEIRPAAEDEIARVLVGCWEREITLELMELERKGYFNSYTLCFGPGDQVATSTVGGDSSGLEGFADGGTFSVEGGKLNLSGSGFDGWFFGSPELSCDVVMRLDIAMRLENCVALGEARPGESLPNMSFSRKAE